MPIKKPQNTLNVTAGPLTQQLTWKPAMRKALPAWSKRICLCCCVQHRPHLLRTQGFDSSDCLPPLTGTSLQDTTSSEQISSTQAFQLYNPVVFISWLILLGLNGLPVGHSFQGWTTTSKSKSHRASSTSYPAPNLCFPFGPHKAYTLTTPLQQTLELFLQTHPTSFRDPHWQIPTSQELERLKV